MRLFVSIDLPDKIIEEVRTWLPERKGWKKVQHHQMHLTLAFLGECQDEELSNIHYALAQIEFKAFDTTISGLSAFPSESAPRIIWAWVEPVQELMKLQEMVSGQVQHYMKSNRSHSYIPHLTLARKKSRKKINHGIKQHLQRNTPVLRASIKEFNLKKSILKPTGSEHQILYRYSAASSQ